MPQKYWKCQPFWNIIVHSKHSVRSSIDQTWHSQSMAYHFNQNWLVSLTRHFCVTTSSASASALLRIFFHTLSNGCNILSHWENMKWDVAKKWIMVFLGNQSFFWFCFENMKTQLVSVYLFYHLAFWYWFD